MAVDKKVNKKFPGKIKRLNIGRNQLNKVASVGLLIIDIAEELKQGARLVREGSAEVLLSELSQEAPRSPKSAGVLLPEIQQKPEHFLHVCAICQLHSDRQEGTPKSHRNCIKDCENPSSITGKALQFPLLKRSPAMSSWFNVFSERMRRTIQYSKMCA